MSGKTQWDWGKQMAVLRAAVFDPVNIGTESKPDRVSSGAIKALLQAIHSRAGETGWCWAALKTLAHDTGFSESQVKRVMQAINQLCLLVNERVREGRSFRVHRRIAFPNLQSHVPSQRFLFGENSQASERDSLASDRDSQASESNFTGQQLATKYPLKKTSKNPLSNQPSESVLSSPGEQTNETCSRNTPPTLKPTIQNSDLIEPAKVQELFEAAVAQQLCLDSEIHRLTFFGLCHRMYAWWFRERFKHPDRNPVGLLHHLLHHPKGINEWSQHVSDDVDRRWATKAIKECDHVEVLR